MSACWENHMWTSLTCHKSLCFCGQHQVNSHPAVPLFLTQDVRRLYKYELHGKLMFLWRVWSSDMCCLHTFNVIQSEVGPQVESKQCRSPIGRPGKLLFEDGQPLTFGEFLEGMLMLRGSNQTTVKDGHGMAWHGCYTTRNGWRCWEAWLVCWCLDASAMRILVSGLVGCGGMWDVSRRTSWHCASSLPTSSRICTRCGEVWHVGWQPFQTLDSLDICSRWYLVESHGCMTLILE